MRARWFDLRARWFDLRVGCNSQTPRVGCVVLYKVLFKVLFYLRIDRDILIVSAVVLCEPNIS